jgi:hypothetical protein
MGDGSSSALCDRFIGEFEGDAIRRFAPTSPGLLAVFKKFYCGFDEANFEVHVYGVMKDPKEEEEFEVSFPDVVYAPFMDDSAVVDSIREMFGLSEEAAVERLKKAKLIASDYKPETLTH